MIIDRIAGVLRAWAGKSAAAHVLGGKLGWEPVARPGAFTPHLMRQPASDGRWLYRDPTEAEIQDFIRNADW